MRSFITVVAALTAALCLRSASSDHERYGSAAWYNAKNNEQHQSNYYGQTANSSTQVDMSAEKAKLARYFSNISSRPNQNTTWAPSGYSSDSSSSSAPPPAPSEEAVNLAKAQQGSIPAMKWLAQRYSNGRTHEASVAAVSWYEAAANAGDIESMMWAYYLQMTDQSGVKNVPKAIQWLKRAADAGDHNGLDQYSLRLHDGAGVPVNLAEAFRYRLKYAESSNDYYSAHMQVAQMYATGEGVEKNPAKAIEWYRKSMRSQDTWPENYAAHLALARLLVENGGGVAKNQVELKEILEPVVSGSPEAAGYYALLKETGELPPRDPAAALQIFTRLSQDSSAPYDLQQLAGHHARLLSFNLAITSDDRAGARAAGLGEAMRDSNFRPLALGFLLIDPSLGKPETNWAFECFEAHQDLPAAQRESALLLNAAGYPDDATRRMEQAAHAGDVVAIRFMADYHRYVAERADILGRSDGERQTARTWATYGAKQHDVDCMARLGGWLLEDSLLMVESLAGPMRTEGIDWLKQAVAQKNIFATARMGEAYLTGNGVERDDTKGVEYLKEASAAGSDYAKARLAFAHYYGSGIDMDKPAALKMIEPVVNARPDAMRWYGEWLIAGDAGRRDDPAGIKALETAGDEGQWQASLQLAKLYHEGHGVPADETKAQAALATAYKYGEDKVELLEAEAYEKGTDITADPAMAKTLYENFGNRDVEKNAGIVAAYFLRIHDLEQTRNWVDQGRRERNAEAIKIGDTLEATSRPEAQSIVDAEKSDAPATIDEALSEIEAYAAQAPDARGVDSNYDDPVTDSTYRMVQQSLPDTPARRQVLAARDLTAAIMGGAWNNAVVAYTALLGEDPVRGPRLIKAIRTIMLADATAGDRAAMMNLVVLNSPIDPTESTLSGKWPRNDHEAIHWARQALLVGDDGSIRYVIAIYGGQTSSHTKNPEMLARWETMNREVPRPTFDDPKYEQHVELVTAYAREHLAPESAEKLGPHGDESP
ncbi:MAG: tetratricopeptide repeat protein [Lacunisphaera sp.]